MQDNLCAQDKTTVCGLDSKSGHRIKASMPRRCTVLKIDSEGSNFASLAMLIESWWRRWPTLR